MSPQVQRFTGRTFDVVHLHIKVTLLNASHDGLSYSKLGHFCFTDP